mgnify:CR=1 FL=1
MNILEFFLFVASATQGVKLKCQLFSRPYTDIMPTNMSYLRFVSKFGNGVFELVAHVRFIDSN